MLCSIPLAATGVSNYLAGEVLSTGVRGFYRIAGYMRRFGYGAIPNDLALMLNLIIPIAGRWSSSRAGSKRLAGGCRMLLERRGGRS